MDREDGRKFVWLRKFFSSSPMSDFLRLALKENLLLEKELSMVASLSFGALLFQDGQAGWGPVLSCRKRVSSGSTGPLDAISKQGG